MLRLKTANGLLSFFKKHMNTTCKFSLKKNLLFLLLSIFTHASFSQVTTLNPRTDMKLLSQFQNGKLGLFVHWMACFSPATGDSWEIGNGTPKSVADSITLAWNPNKFDAKKIVEFAVKAGCKYMVVISKHHDGFSIWDSKYTDFDLGKLKFKKDILKELSIESKKQGLLFGIYYSIADLHYTGWERMPIAQKVPPEPKGGKDSMLQFVHNQVKELMQNYNPDILWFDGYWLSQYWTEVDGKDLYNFVKNINPNILTTRNAVTKDSAKKYETFVPDGSAGDFFSWEANNITKAPVFPWEGCTSVSYPVYAYDPAAKLQTRKELIEKFDKTICANGNFLLNIGPDTDGTLPAPLTNRFSQLSEWVHQNKKAVYHTTGGPFMQGNWGGSTYKDNCIYLHLRKATNTLMIDVIPGYKIIAAKYVATGEKIKISKTIDGYQIKAPVVKNADVVTVIELKLDRKFVFTDWLKLNANSTISIKK